MRHFKLVLSVFCFDRSIRSSVDHLSHFCVGSLDLLEVLPSKIPHFFPTPREKRDFIVPEDLHQKSFTSKPLQTFPASTQQILNLHFLVCAFQIEAASEKPPELFYDTSQIS